MPDLHVELVSAERNLRSADAELVVARTVEGDIGVLAGHTPLVSLLADGVVRVEGSEGGTWTAAVSGGFLSVADNRVSVLAERAMLADDVDVAAARRDAEQARQALEAAGEDEDAQADARADLGYATARLMAAGETV